MDENIWNVTGVKILLPNGTVFERETVTAEEVKNIAREAGIKRFTVERDGMLLAPSAFPITDGDISIRTYNEAKTL